MSTTETVNKIRFSQWPSLYVRHHHYQPQWRSTLQPHQQIDTTWRYVYNWYQWSEAGSCQTWGACTCVEVKAFTSSFTAGGWREVWEIIPVPVMHSEDNPARTLEGDRRSPYMPAFPSDLAVNGACADVPVRMKTQSISGAWQQCHSAHPSGLGDIT